MKNDLDLLLFMIDEAAANADKSRFPFASSSFSYNPYLFLIDQLEANHSGKFESEKLPKVEQVYCHIGVHDLPSAVCSPSWSLITDLRIGISEYSELWELPPDFFRTVDLSSVKALNLCDIKAEDATIDSLLECNTLNNLEKLLLPPISKEAFGRFASSKMLQSLRELHIPWGDFSDELAKRDCPKLVSLTTRASADLIRCFEHTSQFINLKRLCLLEHSNSENVGRDHSPIVELAQSRKFTGQLESLDIEELRDFEFTHLMEGDFPSLLELNLTYMLLTDVDNMKLFARNPIPKLRHLDLRRSVIGDSGLRQLSKWSRLYELETLNLSCTEISSTGLKTIVDGAKDRSLNWRSLDLSGNRVRHGQGIHYLIESQAVDSLLRLDLWEKGLTSLKLSDCDLSECRFHSWDSSIQDSLKVLDVSCTNLNDQGLESIFSQGNFENLMTFVAESNPNITHTGITAVSSSATTQGLREVSFSCGRFGDEALVAMLSGKLLNSSLRTLNINFNEISSLGMQKLLESGRLKNLWEFSISGNHLDDAFAELSFIECFEQLIVLNVKFHEMSPAAVRMIKSKFEDLNLKKAVVLMEPMPGRQKKNG